MTTTPHSASRRAGDDMLAPTASSLRMRALDTPALAATAPPRVTDPTQTVAHESAVGFTEPDRSDDDVVPSAVVRHEGIQSYVWCPCGYTTGYTDSDAQAARIAYDHSLEHKHAAERAVPTT